MATQNPKIIPGLTAEEDFTGHQYRFVKIGTGNKQVVKADTLGEETIGVLQDEPTVIGEAASVADGGTTKIEVNGVIALGAKITTAADGRAAPAGVGEHVHGVALEASTAAGQRIEMRFRGAPILA